VLLLRARAADVLLSERFLSASEQGAERCGMNVERGGEFGVVEIVAAEDEQFGLARGE
jgi:hypothetical protein